MAKLIFILGKSCSGRSTIYNGILEHVRRWIRGESVNTLTTKPEMSGDTHIDGEIHELTYTTISNEMMDDIEQGISYKYHLVKMEEDGGHRYATVLNKYVLKNKYNHTPEDVIGSDEWYTDDLRHEAYIMIGSVGSLNHMIQLFGKDNVLPIYLKTSPKLLIQRAIDKIADEDDSELYMEVCRRFIEGEMAFTPEFMEEYIDENNTIISFNSVHNVPLRNAIELVEGFINR